MIESQQRTITYCIVARDLVAELHEPLRRHWRDDPTIEVIVERRRGERRGRERRFRPAEPPDGRERRAVRNPGGRRVAERRAEKTRVLPPPLPRRARRYAQRLVFVRRRLPSSQEAEDAATARLIVEYQLGDRSALEEIYMRYFDRVYSYARMTLEHAAHAEDVTQDVFARAVEALTTYRVRGPVPFRVWLFRTERELLLAARSGALARQRAEPGLVELHRHRAEPAPVAEDQLDWLSDADLYRFVERLPPVQREVIVLRYLLDLSNEEIAATLDQSVTATRQLLWRALGALERTLLAAGRSRGRSSRSPMRMCHGQAPVIAARRRALHGEARTISAR